MTADKLKQRLQDSAAELRKIVNSLALITSPSLSPACVGEIQRFDEMAVTLTTTCDLIDSREYASQLLQKLPKIANLKEDKVTYQEIDVPFSAARLLGFQSYLSTTWAICDSIILAISPLLLHRSIAENRQSLPNLLSIVVDEKKNVAHYNSFFLLNGYGWPIAVSYIIRNHFVHDGASNYGRDFFAGKSVVDEYKISMLPESGWKFLEKQMTQGKYVFFKKEHTRLADPWPWHQDNLLKLLQLCNDEIDEALSCLVGWSVGMATLQARYLLERDFSAVLPPYTSS